MVRKSKTPIKAKPTADKLLLLQAIRKKLSETELPKELDLEPYAHIFDLPLWFENHIRTIECQDPELAEPCAERLKKALAMVGIDIKELAKTIKKA